MPLDKGLGSDGFNIDFINACWNIIVDDLYCLIDDFYHGRAYLQSNNSCFITLIPK